MNYFTLKEKNFIFVDLMHHTNVRYNLCLPGNSLDTYAIIQAYLKL